MGQGKGLGCGRGIVALAVHSKNHLALIMKSKANSLKTRKIRGEIVSILGFGAGKYVASGFQ